MAIYPTKENKFKLRSCHPDAEGNCCWYILQRGCMHANGFRWLLYLPSNWFGPFQTTAKKFKLRSCHPDEGGNL